MKITKPEGIEKRLASINEIEVREEEGKSPQISGYAAVFNRKSVPLGWFEEILRPGCFRKVLETKPDVKALINHEASTIFARTKTGTLRLFEDEKGLKFEIDVLPDDEDSRKAHSKVKNGLIDQCSFAFMASEEGQKWDMKKDPAFREILEVNQLADISIVVYPAYQQTKAEARSILEEEGLDFDAFTGALFRAQHGESLNKEDRDLISASIRKLEGYLPTEPAPQPEDPANKDPEPPVQAKLRNLEIDLMTLECE